jgi:hypothetical protein
MMFGSFGRKLFFCNQALYLLTLLPSSLSPVHQFCIQPQIFAYYLIYSEVNPIFAAQKFFNIS